MSCIINFYRQFIKKQNNNINSEECCICMEEINEKILTCGHNIHIICILQSKNKTNCPYCTKDISFDIIKHLQNCNYKKCYCKRKDIQKLEEIIIFRMIENFILLNKNITRMDIINYFDTYKIKKYKRQLDLYY